MASSIDGRTFLATTDQLGPRIGQLVVLEGTGESDLLAQVLDVDPDGIIAGAVVGALDPAGDFAPTEPTPFAGAALRAATAQEARALQAWARAEMEVGSWRPAGVDGAARLRAGAFNRHTFLCGQSGSGKTYALGVVLEKLLLETELPVIVLDPNGDFVHLGSPLEDAPKESAATLAGLGVRVLRAGGSGDDALKVRFLDLPRTAQAAVLDLQPVRDRAEYHQWLHLDVINSARDMSQVVPALLDGSPQERLLGQRIENLGVLQWSIWPFTRDAEPVDATPPRQRATVMDLSGFEHAGEPMVAALDLVERLWAARERRQPVLIVIDEAHNICPATPVTPLQKAVTERLIQIAAEGRKYGLWLLLSTQRPSKVHPQVISQCDNLLLMRMNGPADLEDLGRLFGFAPPALVSRSPYFTQGEFLAAGGFVPVPTLGRVGARITREGGIDVRVPMPS